MGCARGGVSGRAASGSNVRNNEAENIEKGEGGIFVLAVGWDTTLARTQAKAKLQMRSFAPAPQLATGRNNQPLSGAAASRPGRGWTSSRVSSGLIRAQVKVSFTSSLGVLLEHRASTQAAAAAPLW